MFYVNKSTFHVGRVANANDIANGFNDAFNSIENIDPDNVNDESIHRTAAFSISNSDTSRDSVSRTHLDNPTSGILATKAISAVSNSLEAEDFVVDGTWYYAEQTRLEFILNAPTAMIIYVSGQSTVQQADIPSPYEDTKFEVGIFVNGQLEASVVPNVGKNYATGTHSTIVPFCLGTSVVLPPSYVDIRVGARQFAWASDIGGLNVAAVGFVR